MTLELKDIIKPGRRVGNTTRLVDYYIQKIFDSPGGWIEIRDHYRAIRADKYLLNKLLDRLGFEHNLEVDKDLELAVNRDIVKIRLKKVKFVSQNMYYNQ